MLKPDENPSHKLIKEIGIEKCESFPAKFNYEAKVMPELLGFTLIELRDLDYMLIAEEYAYLMEKMEEQAKM